MKNNAKELIRRRFIEPTTSPRTNYIGIEIEMPVVPLKGENTDQSVSAAALKEAARRFGFTETKHDAFGVCHEAVCEETGDVFSFDCSYNNFEISLGKVRTLHEAQARFTDYVSYINTFLRERGHLLTGMGINPFYRKNDTDFVPSPRYQMLEGYLRKSREWERDGGFHPYTAYPTFSSASQVQLDVKKDELIDTVNTFGLLEPYKSLLFANSYLSEYPDYLCARNMLWERSMQGFNLHNVGMFSQKLGSIDELIEYIKSQSIYCTVRNGRYIDFEPVPVGDYFAAKSIKGEEFDGEKYRTVEFAPQESDLQYLRTFKFEDLTFRGTIEYRSSCCQPIKDVMTVSAFHTGLVGKLGELKELLENDKVIYAHGYSALELQNMLSKTKLPELIDKKSLRGQLIRILDIARAGLAARGLNEEHYLDALYERAEMLTNPAKQMLEGIKRGKSLSEFVTEYSLV